MKKIIILIAFSLLLVSPVLAQTTTAKRFQDKQTELKNLLQQKKIEFQSRIELRRTELKDKIQAKREELKQRLQNIKDENKKKIVERIDQNIDALNEKILNHFSNVLEHLENVLAKIVSRTDKAEINGRDVTSVEAAIQAAGAAITASRSAIEIQTNKIYTIATSTEDTLRLEVGKARQALHDDLVRVRDAVFAAREAVKKAAAELHKIQGVDELEVATTTPNQ